MSTSTTTTMQATTTMPHASAMSVVIGSIVANLIVSNTVVHVLGKKSHSLSQYYTDLKMIAVGLDITSVTWGVLLAQHILSSGTTDVYKVVATSILVQVVHDVLFSMWLKQNTNQRPTTSLFESYAKEHGLWILLIDATIMTLAVIVSRMLSRRRMSISTLTLIGSFSLYLHLLLLDGL